MKNIAVLTSGGDAPGMNAAIRAVVRKGNKEGFNVYGISHGFLGLTKGDLKKLEVRDVGDIIHRGGTILYSARCEEFKEVHVQQKAVATLREYNIDTVIVIGGDGSFRGAQALERHGIKTIGIPATIDNDIPFTEYTIGFDTSLNTILEALDRIRDTATSHERTFIVEVMGRESGQLALYSGLASGAEVSLVPEAIEEMSTVIHKIDESIRLGKKHSIVIVAEGAISAAECSKIISDALHIEVRTSVLGHIQRGGKPTARDRIYASRFGSTAVDLILEEKHDVALIVNEGKIKMKDFDEVITGKKNLDTSILKMIDELSI
ncbi:6-phosphofructokinase [Phocicoccus pinnipedialis]|uniref:ATP-dependent 6-phosphofructokinase n=1 Tax=Phocicoccus pinnipedialis TaxID=110845 RepID=A0A6V7RBT5_9BACL|nr:6-phosphofructokinase [Jeotgalicoccus pinnipedialis]MBP1939497.1 6-phosphofructokinase 1 [Jeotgalicoccus pinnipedialis]CAD2075137.1 6-phosphofructokinase [Jeotgalicoccus pinnipedialis]